MGSSGITPHPGLLIATAICGFAESDGVITEDELTIFKSAAMVLNSDPALMQSLHAQQSAYTYSAVYSLAICRGIPRWDCTCQQMSIAN